MFACCMGAGPGGCLRAPWAEPATIQCRRVPLGWHGRHVSHWPYLISMAGCCATHMCVQGEKFLDSLDDVAMPGVILLDGMAMWGPPKSVGLTNLKLWLAGWLQQYGVTVAITATTVTPNSNKVRQARLLCVQCWVLGAQAFVKAQKDAHHNLPSQPSTCVLCRRWRPSPSALGYSLVAPAAAVAAPGIQCCCGHAQVFVCFKMLLMSGSSPPGQVDGCVMYVFNIQGFITHMVLYR